MKKVKLIAVTVLACASAVYAVELAQIKNLPRGVQKVKYENGVISTLVVVGKTAVPRALRRNPPRAAQYGGEKARSEAQLEFTRFLSTKCKWGKTTNGGTAIMETAVSAADASGNRTAAEASGFSESEMTNEEKAQSAQAFASGIEALWEGFNDIGEYVWVGGWNAKYLMPAPNHKTMLSRDREGKCADALKLTFFSAKKRLNIENQNSGVQWNINTNGVSVDGEPKGHVTHMKLEGTCFRVSSSQTQVVLTDDHCGYELTINF